MGRRIGIHCVGPIAMDPGLPEWLRGELGKLLGLETHAGGEIALLQIWRDPDSGRYDSNRVIDGLLEELRPGDDFEEDPDHPWALAVTEVDLFAPGHPYVFGEATVGGPLALISLARLRSPDPEMVRSRALKGAVHEIGHLAGVPHCTDRRCVMFPSSDIQDTDAKLERLCAACDRLSRAGRAP